MQHVRLRASAAILDAAATVLAERGDAATMADVAAAAGVGRATLYRYYPSRDALVEALTVEAVTELGARLADAGLATVPAEEAIERIARAVLAVGDRYAVLVRERVPPDPETAERLIAQPAREVIQRGIDEGALRRDVPPEVQLELLGGLLKAGLVIAGEHHLGLEDTAAALTSCFLDGTRLR